VVQSVAERTAPGRGAAPGPFTGGCGGRGLRRGMDEGRRPWWVPPLGGSAGQAVSLARPGPPCRTGRVGFVTGGSDEAGECEARACAGPLSSPAGPLGLLLRSLDLLGEAEAPVLLCVLQ
jgi:hypothetical protein